MSIPDDKSTQRQREYDAGRITTTDGKPPQSFDTPAPAPIGADGQHAQYWVLSDAEREKGFVRPIRSAYRHVGHAGPVHPVRDLTDDERERYTHVGYVKYEAYPKSESSVVGRFWTQAQLDSVGKACNTITTMGRALAETYAREPRFYGATMCVRCGAHFPVGQRGEFVWDGTTERVGT